MRGEHLDRVREGGAKEFGQLIHAARRSIARMAVAFTLEAPAPFFDHARLDPMIDGPLEVVRSGREELSTVVEDRRSHAPCRQAAAHTASLVDHSDGSPALGQAMRRDQSCHSGADDVGVHRRQVSQIVVPCFSVDAAESSAVRLVSRPRQGMLVGCIAFW